MCEIEIRQNAGTKPRLFLLGGWVECASVSTFSNYYFVYVSSLRLLCLCILFVLCGIGFSEMCENGRVVCADFAIENIRMKNV